MSEHDHDDAAINPDLSGPIDSELDALRAVARALTGLPQDATNRVVSWAVERYGKGLVVWETEDDDG